jgi:hypothetical protein
MTRLGIAALMTLSLGLVAWGDHPMHRALSGAGMGAGPRVLRALLVRAPVEVALPGGVVGGAAGALTQRNQIDLGRPMWR